MTTETTLPAQPPAPPQPSSEQLARQARRRSFYRLRVTVPMVLVSLLWLGAILFLLWLAVAGKWFAVDTNQAYYRTLVSGIADFVVVLSLLPLLLLCALPSALSIGFVVYRRQKKQEAPPQPETLPIFWRVENLVIQVRDLVQANILPKLAQPLISAHAVVAFVRAFLSRLWEVITREIR